MGLMSSPGAIIYHRLGQIDAECDFYTIEYGGFFRFPALKGPGAFLFRFGVLEWESESE